MIDQKWSVQQILEHPEFEVRLVKLIEQCSAYGFNFGVETITFANYIHLLYRCAQLPSVIKDRLKAVHFWFSEIGELMSCL